MGPHCAKNLKVLLSQEASPQPEQCESKSHETGLKWSETVSIVFLASLTWSWTKKMAPGRHLGWPVGSLASGYNTHILEPKVGGFPWGAILSTENEGLHSVYSDWDRSRSILWLILGLETCCPLQNSQYGGTPPQNSKGPPQPDTDCGKSLKVLLSQDARPQPEQCESNSHQTGPK